MSNETVLDYLKDLREPYRDKAITNAKAYGSTHWSAYSEKHALRLAFDWKTSPEKLRFWSDLYDKLKHE